MQSKGILVHVEHPSLGSAKGSGLLINNVVIAHGSLLLPLCLFKNDSKDVKKIYNSLLKELEGNQCFFNIPRTAEKFRTQPFKFKIHQDVSPLRINQKLRTSCASTQDVDSSVHKNTLTEEVTLCQIHYYTRFSRIMEEISNWTLIDKDKDIDDEQSLYSVVLPTFFLLMVGEPCKNTFENTLQALFKTSQNINFHPGTPVLIESTPFGNYSFMSAWSRGIISKIVGYENDGFLTDTRLVYGCEGAPVYSFKDGAKSVLLGLILHTISWCNGEWVGFSLGISINHLLKSILEKSSTVDLSRKYLDSSLKFNQINMDYLSSAVVFVRCAHKWGSGVVVDSSQGLILTCAHVIEHYPEPVKVICKQGQFKAAVLFSSPLNEPYDLAVLSVGKVTGLKHLTFADKPAVLGETVFTAGYPLSTESLVNMNTTPTLSSGCVSKISTRGGPLQTTCCTQSGVSGGAVFRPPDHLLGIVVSNVRVDKTVLPSFGIAVSVEDFKEPVTQYLRMGDLSSLQSLHVKSYKVKMDWELRDSKL